MQLVSGDVVTAADALGHVVAGELDVDATGMGAEAAVDGEEALDLVEHVVEPAGLVAARRLEGIAVHRVADPCHRDPLGPDGLDERREQRLDPVGAEPGDEGQPARLPVRA
jgi:hypothetical protein